NIHLGCCLFQAEAGIRVFHVTGVQTCALPICEQCRSLYWPKGKRYPAAGIHAVRAICDRTAVALECRIQATCPAAPVRLHRAGRSEERRVGKEWRYGRSPDEYTRGE